MKQPQVAGGPLGVTRVDRSLRPSRRKASRPIGAAIAAAVRVLAGAAIVEVVAVASFGLVAGTALATLAAMVLGITYLAIGPG